MKTFRWAQVRWYDRDLRINTYIDDRTLLVTRPNNISRQIRICPVIAEAEKRRWQEHFEMPAALRRALKK